MKLLKYGFLLAGAFLIFFILNRCARTIKEKDERMVTLSFEVGARAAMLAHNLHVRSNLLAGVRDVPDMEPEEWFLSASNYWRSHPGRKP